MAFEMYKLEYQPMRGGARQQTPAATIKPGGILSINAAAAKETGEWGAVQLYWDADRRRIGIKLFRADEEGNYMLPLRRVKKEGYAISCKGFLAQYCGLSLNTFRCPVWYDKGKRMLIVEVSKGELRGRKGTGKHG